MTAKLTLTKAKLMVNVLLVLCPLTWANAQDMANSSEASKTSQVAQVSQVTVQTSGKVSNIDSTDTSYNFIRPEARENSVFIPVLSDAKVFAEFVDELPAVVNFFTMASEAEIIAFYSESYGEPVEQERKRGRLNITFYLEDVATRVVISEQDNRRQVDVLQESAAL